MATIRVAQLARIIVISGEEEGSVISPSRVFVKQLFVKQLIARPRNRSGCSQAVTHWLRRDAWRFAMSRAAPMPLPAMSANTRPSLRLPRSRKSREFDERLSESLDAMADQVEGCILSTFCLTKRSIEGKSQVGDHRSDMGRQWHFSHRR